MTVEEKEELKKLVRSVKIGNYHKGFYRQI